MTISPQATYDPRNSALMHVKAVGDLALSSCRSPYFGNLFVAQDAGKVRHKAGINGMSGIAGSGHPLQVSDNVIRLHKVDVVDLRKVFGVWNEGPGNEPVDRRVEENRDSAEVHSKVASVTEHRAQNSSFGPAAVSVTDLSPVETADPPEIADFVELLERGDRHRSPLFDDFGIHVTGLPSGDSGLEIKSPSRAVTLGGLAAHSTTPSFTQAMGG